MKNYINGSHTGCYGKGDVALGKEFAQQFYQISNMLSDMNIQQNLKQIIHNTYQPITNKLIDNIDKAITRNREYAMYGSRMDYVDRNVIFKQMGY